MQECATGHENILPAATFRVRGLAASVRSYTQEPGGETVILRGEDRLTGLVVSFVYGCRTVKHERTYQMMTAQSRLHKGLAGGKEPGSPGIEAIAQGEKIHTCGLGTQGTIPSKAIGIVYAPGLYGTLAQRAGPGDNDQKVIHSVEMRRNDRVRLLFSKRCASSLRRCG